MSEYFATPDDTGEIKQSELQASMGERLGAQALNAIDPQDSPSGMYIARRLAEAHAGGTDQAVGAGGETEQYSGVSVEERQAVIDAQRAAIPDTAIADAKSRVKQEGLEHHLNLPDQTTIKTPVLDLMIQEAHERRDREAAIQRGPQGFLPDALGVVTSIGAGMIDPVNAAAFSIPVLGEARWGQLLARAGDSIAARAGARAAQGAAQGLVGTTALQPLEWWLHSQDGVDYTLADALKSVVMGAGMGAAFHAGIGAFGDVRARMRGAPLEGSPEAQTVEALGATKEAGAPGAEDIAAHPASVLADLPPAAREDVVHASIADMIEGRPVRAAEMLEIAADHDPRIAESLGGHHLEPEKIAAAAIEHEGQIYTGVTHGDAMTNAAKAAGKSIDDMPDTLGSAGDGFVTSHGRYVGREEAVSIANRADQMSPHAPPKPELRAEDLNFDYTKGAMRAPPGNPAIVLGVGEAKAAVPAEAPGNPAIVPGGEPVKPGVPAANASAEAVRQAAPRTAEPPQPVPAAARPLPPPHPTEAAGARYARAADDPRWRQLADARPAFDDPDVLSESKAADRLEEPASLVPERSLTDLERQAADAEEIWRKMEPTLTEAERSLVNDALDRLKSDKEARDTIITDGVACLMAAAA